MQGILNEPKNRNTEQSARKDIDVEDKESQEDPEFLACEEPQCQNFLDHVEAAGPRSGDGEEPAAVDGIDTRMQREEPT